MAAFRPLLRYTSASTNIGSTIRPALSPAIAPFLRVPLTTTTITKPLPNTPRNQNQRPFSISTTKMSAQPLIDASQTRRTIYKLGKNSPVPDSKIEELVNAAINTVPSSFNTQSTRLVVLLHEQHEKLWDLAIDTFSQLVNTGAVPGETWKSQSLPKLQGFKNGVGTVLFYEDPAHIGPFSEKFALYKDHFQPWAEHSNAMHQYYIWTGLSALGFGANLQHYNPVIDAPVAKQWGIPSDWQLISQLVFGSPEGGAGEKAQKPVEERVKIFGKQ